MDLLTTEDTFEGFIVLWRKITHSILWRLNIFEFKIAILCLIKANYTDKQWFNGSKYVSVPRGSFITSRKHFAEEVGSKISEFKVRRTWLKLKNTGFLHIEPHNKYSLLTIANYDKYQFSMNSTPDSRVNNKVNTTNNTNNSNNVDEVFLKNVLDTFNAEMGTNYVRVPSIEDVGYWLTNYTTEKILEAVRKIKYHPLSKDKKMTPEELFKIKSYGQKVDRIGELLNIKIPSREPPAPPGFRNIDEMNKKV